MHPALAGIVCGLTRRVMAFPCNLEHARPVGISAEVVNARARYHRRVRRSLAAAHSKATVRLAGVFLKRWFIQADLGRGRLQQHD